MTESRRTHPRAFALIAALLLGGTVMQASSQVRIDGGQGAGNAQQMINDLLGGMPGAGNKPMDTGAGLIVGRVVDGVDGGGVPGAIVTMTLPGFTPLRVQSDGEGRFAFRALPKGTFNISTSRGGWVDGAAGRTRPGGAARSVTLTDDERVGDVEIPMWRFASITGTVIDEHNEPIVGVTVRVLRRDYTSGRRRLSNGPADTTDDRGQFRISALEAGDYLVVVPIVQRQSLDAMIGPREMPASAGGGANTVFAVRAEVAASGAGGAPVMLSTLDGGTVPSAGTTDDGLPLTYQTEYYTGAVAASRATAVTVTHGEERTGLDFRMTPVRAMTVSGSMTGPDGPAANVQLQLLPADAEDLTTPIETATTMTSADGNFTFSLVPAGQYTLRAIRQPRTAGQPLTFTQSSGDTTMMIRQAVDVSRAGAPLPDQPTLWADMPVSVGGRDLTGLAVTLRPGLTVSGTVHFSGSAAQPTPEQRAAVQISLEPADGRTAGLLGMVRGRVDQSGTFTTIGVPTGKYVLRVTGAPQGWTLRDATFGGRDITSAALELDGENAVNVLVTFSDRATEVHGAVRDSNGNADAKATVLIFPADQSMWVDTGSQPRRLRQTRAGQDGSYRIQGLPPGSYLVVAIDDASSANWQDPAYLAQLSRTATEVRLTEGDTRTQALTAVRGGR